MVAQIALKNKFLERELAKVLLENAKLRKENLNLQNQLSNVRKTHMDFINREGEEIES